MKNTGKAMLYSAFAFMGIISSCGSSKNSSMSNVVARMEVKEPIEGVCDNANVFVILPISGNGQVAALPSKTKEELTKELNEKVSFLKDKADYEDKGMISMIINCKGELVSCKMDNKTRSPELDTEIVAVFAQMKTWVAGKINNKAVDTVELESFTISKGKISLN